MLGSRLARLLVALLVSHFPSGGAGGGAAARARCPIRPRRRARRSRSSFEQVTRDTHLEARRLGRGCRRETWHPEGIVKLGDGWIVSSVQVTEPTVKYPDGQIIDGTDRTPGAGFGHLMRFDAAGRGCWPTAS